MIEIKNKYDCTGCHACQLACPAKCIEMQEDEQGFKYPVVNAAKCIGCGLCEKVCHIAKEEKTFKPDTAYAARNNNLAERMNSSSGGIFVAAARWIIRNGGSVYGAAFDDSLEVRHIRVVDEEKISLLQTSKYVQSIIGNTYQEAKNDLEAGKYVLFTGTPCQIAGLKAYLQKDYNKLFCQDIMCHGVPSPKFWRKYLKELKLGEIKSIKFRDKTDGWSNYHVNISCEKGSVYDVFNKNTYMRAFIADASLRPSCYYCRYKHMKFSGDYVLADFWGVADVLPEFDDDKGVSLILTNSEKGNELINAIRGDIDLKQVDIEKAVTNNGAAINGAAMNDKNTALFDNIDKMTVHRIVEKYIRGSLLHRVMNKIIK